MTYSLSPITSICFSCFQCFINILLSVHRHNQYFLQHTVALFVKKFLGKSCGCCTHFCWNQVNDGGGKNCAKSFLRLANLLLKLNHLGKMDWFLCIKSWHSIYCLLFFPQPGELDKKYSGLLEKKWTSVIRLQKKVGDFIVSSVILPWCDSLVWNVLLGDGFRSKIIRGREGSQHRWNLNIMVPPSVHLSFYFLLSVCNWMMMKHDSLFFCGVCFYT